MNANDVSLPAPWTDPDDAPEWTEEMFARADLYEGNVLVRRGRPRSEHPKVPVSIRLSEEVVGRFKASGPGWQSRIDAALKDWLNHHPGEPRKPERKDVGGQEKG